MNCWMRWVRDASAATASRARARRNAEKTVSASTASVTPDATSTVRAFRRSSFPTR